MKREILENVLYVILGIFLAVIIYQGLGFALNTDNPLVTVASCSMYPSLKVGDLIVLKGSDSGDDIQKDDIIVYNSPVENKLIIHRVIEVNDDGSFQTKGDNNPEQLSYEKHIELEDIHGESLIKIPFLGYPRIVLNILLGDQTKKLKC